MNPTTPPNSTTRTNITTPTPPHGIEAAGAGDGGANDGQPTTRGAWLPARLRRASATFVGVWRSLPRYWRWFIGHGSEPSTRMFSGIRVRLTLWYCAALAALLLIAGTIVYEGTQYALLPTVPPSLAASAQSVSAAWQLEAKVYGASGANPNQPFPGDPYHNPYQSCPVPGDAMQNAPYIECWTQAGLAKPQNPNLPLEFQGRALQAEARANASHTATTVVQGQDGLGEIKCYALVVPDPTTPHGILGVVQVGVSIQGQITALHTLLFMLLLVGALTLLGAALSGLWLANRAMQPARLAFDRQQAFIADAAHELRTPLTLMRADAEVLLRGRNRLQPGDAELLDDIIGETAHMGALTTNLLTLARLDAGAQRIERDIVDLSAVASLTLRRAQALADARQITVADITKPQDRPTLVVGDQGLLLQVALILLDNALKYTLPGGAVTIRVARVGWQAALEVKDTGVGVAAEDLRRLGERFYRVDKARSREMGGAGLGLAIARGVAAAHQGALTLTSQPGQGTTATLTLPAATLAGQPGGSNHALSDAEDAANTDGARAAADAQRAPSTPSPAPSND